MLFTLKFSVNERCSLPLLLTFRTLVAGVVWVHLVGVVVQVRLGACPFVTSGATLYSSSTM